MYSSFLSRLKTYDSRSPQSYQDKYSLAQCGFTYTGTDDLVQCYYCGLLLGKWEKNDEPWSRTPCITLNAYLYYYIKAYNLLKMLKMNISIIIELVAVNPNHMILLTDKQL